MVFNQQACLPKAVGCFEKMPYEHSQITVSHANYDVTFLSTGGPYPSRARVLTQRHGNLDSVVAFSKLSESLKAQLMHHTQTAITGLENHINIIQQQQLAETITAPN